jgi:hypothetical protein
MWQKSIKNFIKVSLVLSVFLPFGVIWAADLNFVSSVVVSIDGNEYVIRANSLATEITAGDTNITISVPSGAQAILESPDRFTLNNNAGVASSCDDTRSYLELNGEVTVTITPSATTSPSCSENNNGGGGGGSGGSKKNTTKEPAVVLPRGCFPGFKFSYLTGKSCDVAPGVVSQIQPVATGNAYSFSNTLVRLGTKGEACKVWQKFFNEKMNANLAVDGWCGKMTIATAKTWQKTVGLDADGLLGPASRAEALK